MKKWYSVQKCKIKNLKDQRISEQKCQIKNFKDEKIIFCARSRICKDKKNYV